MNKKKMELLIPSCILFFFAISIISIYSTTSILSINYENIYLKQLIWYALGVGIFISVIFIGNEKILRFSKLIYITSIILLILVLIIGTDINNTKGWINLGFFSFQPSEFAKLGLVIYLSKILNDYHFEEVKNYKKEIILILKIIELTLIPCFLVFVEPDTGAVIAYLIIAASMIFISEIRTRWVAILFLLSIGLICFFAYFYIKFPTNFINFFGDSLYYRIFRIVDWKNSSGLQLENSLITIGTSNLFGHGVNNLPVYFPEPYTDFIFPVFISNFGLIGGIVLITVIIIFDLKIIDIGIKSSKSRDKYIICGIIISFIYPQLQNIAMTIGLIPITGIPLPFISYGGSSLIISFIMTGLVLNSLKNNNT